MNCRDQLKIAICLVVSYRHSLPRDISNQELLALFPERLATSMRIASRNHASHQSYTVSERVFETDIYMSIFGDGVTYFPATYKEDEVRVLFSERPELFEATIRLASTICSCLDIRSSDADDTENASFTAAMMVDAWIEHHGLSRTETIRAVTTQQFSVEFHDFCRRHAKRESSEEPEVTSPSYALTYYRMINRIGGDETWSLTFGNKPETFELFHQMLSRHFRLSIAD